ncbi:MAG: TRAP transporter fused permease subunit [Hyphomicrobiaceae bacterium]
MTETKILTVDAADTEAPVGVAHQLTGFWKLAFQVPAVGLGLFALWSAGPGIAEDHIHLGVYTLVTWVLALLVLPMRQGMDWDTPSLAILALAGGCLAALFWALLRLDLIDEQGPGVLDYGLWTGIILILAALVWMPRALDFILIGLACISVGYFMWEYRNLIERAGAWTKTDFGIAVVATIIALEVARRALGPWIPAISIFAMLYAYFGEYFPASISHAGVDVEGIVNYIFYSQDGIFGVMTNVMAQFVLIFIFLGAFMQSSGMGRFFIDFPLSIAGRSAGGPAKVSVIASAVFGSISGSSLANIVSTGSFTIPLMKRVGFRPVVAGAVENTASLGGQLLPPVMGAGVFVMAEITGVPYLTIISVAAVPALLYLLSIGLIVHFEAKKNGIEGLPEAELRSPGVVFREGWFHLLPFAVLLGFLIRGYSPDWCAVMAIASVVLINWTRVAIAKFTSGRMPDQILSLPAILKTLITGTRNSLLVGGAAGAVGIIVGMIAMTSLGLKMSLLLVDLADGSLFLTVVLVAIASLLLGMALPITASYLVLVVLAGPAFDQLGVPILAAHLIVFWLSQDSNITPPVCLGAFVAASIARADPWKTGWMSFRFAKMLYIMPLLFAFSPILNFGDPVGAVWTMMTATVGVVAFAAWTMGYLHRETTPLEWTLLAAAALMCFMPLHFSILGFVPGYVVNIFGVLLLASVLIWQRQSLNTAKNAG